MRHIDDCIPKTIESAMGQVGQISIPRHNETTVNSLAAVHGWELESTTINGIPVVVVSDPNFNAKKEAAIDALELPLVGNEAGEEGEEVESDEQHIEHEEIEVQPESVEQEREMLGFEPVETPATEVGQPEVPEVETEETTQTATGVEQENENEEEEQTVSQFHQQRRRVGRKN